MITSVTPAIPQLPSEIVDAGVTGLASLYAARRFDAVMVIEHYLDRIDRFDGRIGAFVDLDRDTAGIAAAASAKRWRAGRPLSALDGVPIAVKSNIAVAGLPWTAGIGAYRHRIAATDTASVAALRAAGAIILGTVNMDEAALGATTDNPWFGRTMNPYRDGYTAGGSSGGSAAAVAAGFCAAALGTDTLGSIRIPASYCGVFGYKPAFDSVDRAGIVALAPALDTLSVLARRAADCALIMAILAPPPDPPPQAGEGYIAPSPAPAGEGPGGGVSRPSMPPLTAGVLGFYHDPLGQALSERLHALGATVMPMDFDPEPFDRFMRAALFVAEADGAETHEALLRDPAAELSPGLRRMFGWGRAQPAAALEEARAALAGAKQALLPQLMRFDCVLMPATPSVAHRFGEAGEREAARFTLAASLSGLPAVAFPLGTDATGLPRSAQIVASDARLALSLADLLAEIPPAPRLG